MDREKTDNTKSWVTALKQYNKIKNWSYLEDFLKLCKSFNDNEDAFDSTLMFHLGINDVNV